MMIIAIKYIWIFIQIWSEIKFPEYLAETSAKMFDE